MAWREVFLSRFSAGGFAGVTFGRWLGVLRAIHLDIDLPYWWRAAVITSGSIPNTFLAWLEQRIYDRRIRRTKVEPPLFILGIWRSGTTHLHNLLAQDRRFAYPNTFQTSFPATFLLTEKINHRFVGFFLPGNRPQDNMAFGVQMPQEDEFAICTLTGRSPMLSWAFPRQAARYDRYLTMREATPADVAQWKAALYAFVQKLTFKYGRPLVLKSPGHTCRIKLLLDLFPDARFVHIHRNPYDVFRSTEHTARTVTPLWALQRPDYRDLHERTIRQYRELYDVYFEECELIPRGRFHEVSYEALEKDPVGQVRGIYEALNLPGFQAAEPVIRQYVETLSGYKKNAFPDLEPELRARIAQQWRRCFEEWGYPV
jgi:hypothetical protein